MKPYYEHGGITIYHGDCREILPKLVHMDVVITDPPYGDTSLSWDVPVVGWLPFVDCRSLWCFGSFRFWLSHGQQFSKAWTYGQDVVWEKHNGSSFHADRFRRVHELVVHWYKGPWSEVYKSVLTTPDATARTVRRKARPPHTGHIEAGSYQSHDGGPRLMRSVLRVRSAHGEAQHPTQKPLGIVAPLIAYSSPPGAVVVDPFAGSGTTLRAAKDLGRRAIGIEIEERYCEIAAERMNQTVLELTTPEPAK